MDGITNGVTGQPPSKITDISKMAHSLRAWWLCEVLYAPITLTIRASVCVLLLRMVTSKVHRWIIWVNFTCIALVSVAVFLVFIFQCRPVPYFWRQAFGEQGSCLSDKVVPASVFVHSILSALSDWCLGLLPIAIVWNVKINGRTKAAIAVLLSLGMM